MASHALNNIDNYKPHYVESSCEIFAKYLSLMGEYILQCMDNIHMRNTRYYEYVINKGLQTISHVFLSLFLYTKNLNLTVFHCQKAIYYYIEFIGQIGDDNHSFLQLNSKDAALFVYKKTIFEIDNAFRKEFAAPKLQGSVLSNIELLISIYTEQTERSLANCALQPDDKTALVKIHNPHLISLSRGLLNLSSGLGVGDEEAFGKKLELVRYFSRSLVGLDQNALGYTEVFTRKLRKKSLTMETLQFKLHSRYHQAKLETTTPQKYTNWLFAS